MIRRFKTSDQNFITSAIRSTVYNPHKVDVSVNLSSYLTLVACDDEDENVLWGFIIINNDNDIVYLYTKPIFRRMGLAKLLIKEIPDRPQFFTVLPKLSSLKILKSLNLKYKVSI